VTDKKTWFELSANQGQVLEDSLLVTNKSKDPLTLSIYSTDASHKKETGSFHAGHTNETPENVGKWTQISPQTISLTPFQTKEIPFTITVPEETENGEYYGAIMASPVVESDNSAGTKINKLPPGCNTLTIFFNTAASSAICSNKFVHSTVSKWSPTISVKFSLVTSTQMYRPSGFPMRAWEIASASMSTEV